MPPRALRPDSPRGRQAEARRNDLAVLAAARDVISEQGADAPVAAIAARAGVGMGTLYRRYGSKSELIARLCLIAMEQLRDAARQALAEPDAWAGLSGYVRECVAARAGALTPLAGRFPVPPELRATASDALALAEQVVERAHAQGALRADVTSADISLVIEYFGNRRPATRTDTRLLAIMLDGLATTGPGPLPGPAPDHADLERRWLGDTVDR